MSKQEEKKNPFRVKEILRIPLTQYEKPSLVLVVSELPQNTYNATVVYTDEEGKETTLSPNIVLLLALRGLLGNLIPKNILYED